MFRTSDIVLIAVMVSAAAFTYKTKHEAEDWLGQVRKLEREIRFEEDTIDLLKADWSLLTQPSRLQKLTEIYHGRTPARAGRRPARSSGSTICRKPLDDRGPVQASARRHGAGRPDPITTGGVVR